jgi:hypothetical protein
MLADFLRRLIFFHIPKTAGRTVRGHLLSYAGSFANFWGETDGLDLAHLSVRESEVYLSRHFVERATKFCVIRNPYDRLYSAFKERQYAPTFREFVRDLYTRREFPLHCRPQHTFIYENGRLQIDRILRYEQLTNDLERLLIDFGYPLAVEPVEYASNHETSYVHYYDGPSIEAVNHLFEKDFLLFGYQPICPTLASRVRSTNHTFNPRD